MRCRRAGEALAQYCERAVERLRVRELLLQAVDPSDARGSILTVTEPGQALIAAFVTDRMADSSVAES
jgi:DNA-binding MarR family transcriptional regulator